MKNILIILLLLASFKAFSCDKIVEGYETKDTMYSICPNFAELPDDMASKLVYVLLKQYRGPPDEILIYFVASKEFVGKDKELLGYYYTHSHEIVVHPGSEKETKFKVTWKQ
ncbi:MAG: hypothetical protein K6L81_12990 [Agarilytica sp.]